MGSGNDRVAVPLDRLTGIVDASLRKIGVPECDVAIVRDVLLYAELRGNNQGLVKIPARGVLPRPDAGALEVRRRMPCVTHIDANGRSGMATLAFAAVEAVALAQAHGVGLVAVRNRSGSTGAIGYYAEMIAARGVVGIILGGSPKAVAPVGTVDPLLGTNPLAIGVPAAGGTVVLDMATASIAWYGLVQAANRGEPIASGIAYGPDGVPTTDPAAALKGAIAAFAGAKGSGLALMIELLTGPLIGNSVVSDTSDTPSYGEMVIAVSPAAFGEPAEFIARTDAFLRCVKSARRVAGGGEILLPGERGNRCAEAARRANRLELDRSLYEQLVGLAG